PGLIETARILDLPITRLLLAVEGESSCDGQDPSLVVARQFFAPSYAEQVKGKQVMELQGHTNARTRWPLPAKLDGEAQDEIEVNRIEHGEARWALSGGKPVTSLAWKFDVNTGPEGLNERSIGGDAFVPFYERAAAWITERLGKLDAR